MAFGPIMKLQVNELAIELAPLASDDMKEFVLPGMQQFSITKYLGRHMAPVYEDEPEWFEKTRNDRDSLVWGIYVVKDGERILIGNTAVSSITREHTIQGTSGSMIFRKEYWGKGIASAAHKARTWYLFYHLGFTRIKSAVTHGNIASLKALEKSGYQLVYVERNTVFIDGSLTHQDNLECLNPSDAAWGLWWGSETPPARAFEARDRTLASMQWAQENVIVS